MHTMLLIFLEKPITDALEVMSNPIEKTIIYQQMEYSSLISQSALKINIEQQSLQTNR